MKFVPSREEIILKYARGKEILDCGCAGILEFDEDWLHGKLVKVAKKVVGVDLWKEGVKRMREKGYEVVWGDITTINLRREFDVIVAGEILEHLPNPGMFLENMKKHLRKKGVLILSTPNAWAPYWWTDFLTWNRREKRTSSWGPSPHVAFYTPDTLWALAETHGFRVEFFGCPTISRKREPKIKRMISFFQDPLCRVFPQLSTILIAILRPR